MPPFRNRKRKYATPTPPPKAPTRWQKLLSGITSNDRFAVGYKDVILCKTVEDAQCIAAFLDAYGFSSVNIAENVDAETWKWEVYTD